MRIHKSANAGELGVAAATEGAEALVSAIEARGHGSIVLATGASQFATLENLRAFSQIDWSKVTAFHLDEYVGLSVDHPGSFVRYLEERFRRHVPALREFVFIDGTAADAERECDRLGERISKVGVDVAFIGIGENAHLAFNDPPADFDTRRPYHVVELDAACRRQQFTEGWFASIDDVPTRAISMSIHQILQCRKLVVSVPDERKAPAVRCAVEGPVTNQCPASILRSHSDCSLFLDEASATLLTG